jgi:hypothetical protein
MDTQLEDVYPCGVRRSDRLAAFDRNASRFGRSGSIPKTLCKVMSTAIIIASQAPLSRREMYDIVHGRYVCTEEG